MTGSDSDPKVDGQIGYGRPPLHSRFRKGQSGNPSGRRRLSDADRARKLILQETYRLLTIRTDDRVTRIPALRAVLRSQIASAAKGNVAAQRAVLKAIQEIEAEARLQIPPPAVRKLPDANDLSDEELMAFLEAAAGGGAMGR
jgi:hypothetical protein